ncbi:MAG: hypothetical protein MSIBF_06905 [Candidatus Altiarchaeales archaeon IMC4]|nr:MAG: hypothetical protein MSIBF_06905 [Candidatus Altiarchaeales archaeon IMC4]
MTERVKTGIKGLDEMLHGGLIEGRPYLVSGGPGAGKTILCMQFLMEGAKNKEKGLYISLEEPAAELKKDMVSFGWDLQGVKIMDATQEAGSGIWLLKTDSVMSKPEFNVTNLIKVINDKLVEYKPKRIVIDSVTSIRLLYERKTDMRRDLLSLINFLIKSGCTTMLTAETGSREGNSLMEEFLTSGLIKLHSIETRGERISAVSVDKMRGSDFDRHIRPMKITNDGIVVFSSESIFE